MDMTVTNNANGKGNQESADNLEKFKGHPLWHSQDRIGKLVHGLTNKFGKLAYDIGKAAHEIRVSLEKTAEKVGKVIRAIWSWLSFRQGIPRKILRMVPITLCMSLAGYILVFPFYLILSLFGWTSIGVTSGSVAALWQSGMGGFIPAGSLFAFLQSIAMRAWL